MSYKPINPFFTGINIPNEYFCDRKNETEDIIKRLENGKNIVLKSPRRIGKTSLIMHVFEQEEIKKKYNTLFVDVNGTRDMDGFVAEFKNAFLDAPFARSKRGAKALSELFQRIFVQVNLSPAGQLDGFRLGLSSAPGTSFTLSEMFKFLENTRKPNILVFDEFQKVLAYPEDAAAILRTHVQKLNNTRIIFSGSSRHLLHRMFEYSEEPFYRSASSMDLDIITLESYREFCKGLFSLYKKEIADDAVDLAYHLFSGNTYDMQEVMRETFQDLPKGKKAERAAVVRSVQVLLDQRNEEFRDRLDKLDNLKARRVLFAIAEEGIATGLTSTAIIKQYHLDNASSVQNALKLLSDDKQNFIKKVGKASYCLQDRFFELWIARQGRRLESKIERAEARFLRELSFTKDI